jgi:hypothetical protein
MINDRTYLHNRHRLSHQQIDRLLGEESGKKYINEKVKLMDFTGSFLRICDMLSESGISFVSLKGPLLSNRLYKDPSVRISHDIDLLIANDQIVKTINLLIGKGFRLSKGVIWPESEIQREFVLSSDHHLSLFSSSEKITVEIHWTLMQGLPLNHEQLLKIISENLVTEELSARRIITLSEELELLFLMIHGSKHGWSRLKWLVDIKDYPSDTIDIEIFAKLASEFKAGRIITQTNHLLQKIFGVQTPFTGEKSIPAYFANHPLKLIQQELSERPSIKELAEFTLYWWYMFREYHYKWTFLASFFLRNGDFGEIHSELKIIYYIYRPIGFLKRRLTLHS